MKKILVYGSALLALLFASCAKSEEVLPAENFPQGEGGLTLRVMTETRVEGGYDPMDYCTIRIYGPEGLIRRYDSTDEMPETLQLLAGSYSVDVEAGDRSAASFTNRSYKGREEFVVTAGKLTPVEVVCKTLNATVAVNYAASVAENLLPGFRTEVRMGGDVLAYTESATGYFLPVADDTELSWTFAGAHAEKGAVEKTGTLKVKAGGKYTLNFAYSEDAAGLLSFTVTVVDPEPENGGDVIIFSPEPTFKGEDFDLSAPQKLFGAARNILLTSPNPLSGLTMTLDGTVYDLVNAAPAGVTLTRSDDKNWIVALTDELFAAYAGGDHELLFTATDTEGGSGKAAAVFSTQGIVPATAADYDLWSNTGDIRVKVYDPAVTTVQVKLRRAGGEWKAYEAVRTDGETFTATVAAAWTETQNEAGGEVWRPDPSTGIFANALYEAKAVIGGEEKSAVATFSTAVDQPIRNGGFEDGTESCFSINNGDAPFWGSGNNNYMGLSKLATLCTWQSFAGQGGEHCARLASQSAVVLAAGNLFTGTFVKPSTQGTVGFGVDYDWKARPTALRLKYHAAIGTVNLVKYKDESGNDPIAKGGQDKARIFVAIVDWDSRHGVSSGLAAPTGMWDPASWYPGDPRVTEGDVIGYGSLWIDGPTAGDSMVQVELPLSFYDRAAKPSKDYKLVISCSANAYGDYMCGCSSNVLYVDDFEWVY